MRICLSVDPSSDLFPSVKTCLKKNIYSGGRKTLLGVTPSEFFFKEKKTFFFLCVSRYISLEMFCENISSENKFFVFYCFQKFQNCKKVL